MRPRLVHGCPAAAINLPLRRRQRLVIRGPSTSSRVEAKIPRPEDVVNAVNAQLITERHREDRRDEYDVRNEHPARA